MGKSHLYWGFRYVGVLKSILSQRNIQSFLLKQCSNALLRPGAFLSVGTAFGEELAYFAQEGALDLWDTIVGIDIVGDVEEHVLSQPSLSSYSERLSFEELDLMNLPSPFGEGYWHCIQCGFVLEDIEYANKQSAYDKLFQSLHDGGGAHYL